MGWQDFSSELNNDFSMSAGRSSPSFDMGQFYNTMNSPVSAIPSSNWFSWNSPQTGSPSFGIEQSYNAMNSPARSISSSIASGVNPYSTKSPDWFSMEGFLGNGQTGGWAMPAIQGLQSMFNWNLGNKAMGLAKDQFNFSKELAQKNLANQTSLLNTAMQDRQNARRSASSSYQDTGSYMSERGL